MRLQARDNLSTPVGEKMVSLFNSIKIQRRKRKIEIQRNMKVTSPGWHESAAWKQLWPCSCRFSILQNETCCSLTHSTARGFLQCGSTHWSKRNRENVEGSKMMWVMKIGSKQSQVDLMLCFVAPLLSSSLFCSQQRLLRNRWWHIFIFIYILNWSGSFYF